MIKRNYYKVVRVFPDPSSYFYIKNETMSVGGFSINNNNNWLNTANLEYSFDKVNWVRITDSNYMFMPADGYMYLRNTSGTFYLSSNSNIFIGFDISLGGDVRTLFNYTDVDSVTKIPDYGLYKLVYMQNNAKITDISNLSFRGITEIGIRGLASAFAYNHTGTKGVDLRDVTTLGDEALESLYHSSANLTEVYAPNVNTWNSYKTYDWLYNVASSGVVYKPTNLTIPTGSSSGIPYGWTTQDYPEE